MSMDGTNNNNSIGTTTNSLLLQKFLNGDVDLRSIEQRDLRVFILLLFFLLKYSIKFVFFILSVF